MLTCTHLPELARTSVNGRHGKGGWHLELGAPSCSMKKDNEERQKRCFQHCQATEAIGFYLVMCVLTGASYYTVSTCIKVTISYRLDQPGGLGFASDL